MMQRLKDTEREATGDIITQVIEFSVFPDEYRELARRWMAEHRAAHRIVRKIEEKGVAALIDDKGQR